MTSRFQNNLRFAFSKETSAIRESLPLNQIEKIGDKLSWFAYDFKESCLKTFSDLRVITVCFTAFAMIFAALLFYPSNTWDILSTMFDWIVDAINWDYIRFCLWLLSEVTIFGIGMRAFGRFTNPQLLKYYNEQNVVS
jgi:hypothetical protein